MAAVGRSGRGLPGRRRVVYISETDRSLLAHGEAPSWQQPGYPIECSDGNLERFDRGNDRRLLEEVPPHWEETRL